MKSRTKRNTFKRRLERSVTSLLDHSRVNHVIARLRYQDRPNAVFLKLPKTAGTSIQLALDVPKYKRLRSIRCNFLQKGLATFGHLDYKQLVDNGLVSREFDETAFKFTFVRNPFDRMVSLYHYLMKRGLYGDEVSFLGFCRMLDQIDVDPIGLVNTVNYSQCNPQVRWTEHVSLNYVGKFERLEDDVKQVAGRLNLPFTDLPHARRSVRGTYPQYFCAESVGIVKRLYKEDFEAFEYDISELD